MDTETVAFTSVELQANVNQWVDTKNKMIDELDQLDRQIEYFKQLRDEKTEALLAYEKRWQEWKALLIADGVKLVETHG